MIDSKELMIGNWIENNSKYYNVEAIDSTNVHEDGSKGSVTVFINDLYGTAGRYLNKCNPIPLTPELLHKCGFVFSDFHSQWHIGDNPLTHDWILSITHIDDRFFYRNAHFKIEYLHQLQNLHFALTSQELKVTI